MTQNNESDDEELCCDDCGAIQDEWRTCEKDGCEDLLLCDECKKRHDKGDH